jgi:hypothetical protein
MIRLMSIEEIARVVCTAVVALVLGAWSAEPASAGSIVYDGFNYDVGSKLKGQSGGFGWNGGWTDAGSGEYFTIVKGSLKDPTNTLRTSGNSTQVTAPAGTTASVSRAVASDMALNPPTTYWVSFLLEPTAKGIGSWVLALAGSGNTGLWIEKPSDSADYGLSLSTLKTPFDDTKVKAAQDTTVFLVAQINLSKSGSSSASLYVDPTPGKSEPMGYSGFASVTGNSSLIGTLDLVRLQATSSWVFDEFRIGTTFADVAPTAGGAPNPEPSSLILMGLGVAGALGYAWRRKSTTA